MNNDYSLENKVIVVTGACGLLGFEYVKAIAKNGGTPILLDINSKNIEEKVSKINNSYNVKAYGYKVDISDENQIKSNSNNIIINHGKIDGLINNAANNPKVEKSNVNKNFSRLENFSINNWNDDISVGLTGSFLCAKHYGYLISKNLDGGSIINISSDLGLIAPDQSLYYIDGLDDENQPVKPVTYSIIKSGLIGLTRYISTYWAKNKVRCNAICPGGVFNDQPNDFLERFNKKVPMGRMAYKNELEGIIIYLLSDLSSYTNGAVIPVDGGRTAW
ncbi:MAG: oxidoreductase [Gammaproteobacteria bacterium]|nr:oxidoreductase [Gammaproteobacteria bacterium]|tara:strand:- start:36 stop:863 length:828 start_codon:yes stop_codon:yes gene_type:complete